MKNRDYYNCVFPEKRPRSVWVVYSMQGKKMGEVAAMTEDEARKTVKNWMVKEHIGIPFRLSHVEE
jgi:hypothetical protein